MDLPALDLFAIAKHFVSEPVNQPIPYTYPYLPSEPFFRSVAPFQRQQKVSSNSFVRLKITLFRSFRGPDMFLLSLQSFAVKIMSYYPLFHKGKLSHTPPGGKCAARTFRTVKEGTGMKFQARGGCKSLLGRSGRLRRGIRMPFRTLRTVSKSYLADFRKSFSSGASLHPFTTYPSSRAKDVLSHSEGVTSGFGANHQESSPALEQLL